MRSIPVDPARVSVAFIGAREAPAFDERSGRIDPTRQRADRDGVPLWRAEVVFIVEGARSDTAEVSIPSSEPPTFEPLTRVELADLVAEPWERDGRSGVAYKAAGIRAATSTNGSGSRSQVSAPASTEPTPTAAQVVLGLVALIVLVAVGAALLLGVVADRRTWTSDARRRRRELR